MSVKCKITQVGTFDDNDQPCDDWIFACQFFSHGEPGTVGLEGSLGERTPLWGGSTIEELRAIYLIQSEKARWICTFGREFEPSYVKGLEKAIELLETDHGI